MIGKKKAAEEYRKRINNVVDYIDRNIGGKINLGDMAKAAYFSPFHFHRLFTSLIGETPNEFVIRLRVEKAAHMMIYRKSLSITEFAFQCGFSSSASFSRSFKQHYGMSATDWMKNGNSKICKIDSKKRQSIDTSSDYVVSPNNNNGGNKMKVDVKEMPGYHVAYVANLKGYDVDKIGEAWDKLCQWAGPRGLINDSTKFIGISFDDPAITDKDKCRYYACLTVPDNIESEKEVGILDIKPGKHAVYNFTGCAEDIEKAYSEIYAGWLPGSGYQPADQPTYEVYLEEPKGEPLKFVMNICVPVEPL